LYEKLAREQEAGRTEVFLAQAYALAHDPVAARLCLERALARFARIGAQGDLAKAQAALAAQTFSL
jgi:hypothetical protein